MTLVQNLAHLHGGSVDLRSDGVNAGTEVILDLPVESSVRSVSPEPDAASTAAPPAVLRILVADDNDDGLEMMRYYLESQGHTVVTAADGPKALAAFDRLVPRSSFWT